MRIVRLFALPVALLLLVAQCIPALWQMNCPETGRITAHWFEAKTCCKHETPPSGTASFQKQCCTFTKAQAALDVQQRASVTHLPEQAPPLLAEFPSLELGFGSEGVVSHLVHRPPDRGAPLERLLALGVLRL